MRLVIPWETARLRHPLAVEDILAQLVRGKSKEKGTPADKLVWAYEWCTRVDNAPLPETIEERVEYFLTRSHIGLVASKGRWHAGSDVPLTLVPPEVRAWYEEGERRRAQDQARFAALSPQEKAKEVQELLGCLRGQPGFVELQLPREGTGKG